MKVLIAKERKGLGLHTPGLMLKPHVLDDKMVWEVREGVNFQEAHGSLSEQHCLSLSNQNGNSVSRSQYRELHGTEPDRQLMEEGFTFGEDLTG